MKVTTWTNWYANQPDNLLGNQDAVATDTKEEGLWWDKDTTNGDTLGEKYKRKLSLAFLIVSKPF